MLTSIELDKFKSYGTKTSFDIKPLTILCGVNSSGKSSLIKSLLLLKQSYENQAASNEVTFNDKYCNCGIFRDVIFNRENGNFIIKSGFKIARGIDKNGDSNDYRDTTFYKELCRMYYLSQRDPVEFHISSAIEVTSDNNDRSSLVIGNKIQSYQVTIDVTLSDGEERTIFKHTEIHLQRISNSPFRYNVEIKNVPFIDQGSESYSGELNDCACYFSGVSLTNIYATNMEQPARNMLANLFSIFRIISNQHLAIKFIAPLRESPKRYYISDRDVFDVGVSGENTVLLFAKNKKRKKINIVEPLDSEESFCANHVDMRMSDLVQKWMDYFELGTLTLTGNEILQMNVDGHNIVDVGFGVSQTVPIIVQALIMKKDETLILEQPEIHLHPQMQMRMADFLLAQAMSKKNMIVETHSDHIVNRICRRVMEDPSLLDFVNIYFIDKDKTGATIRQKVTIDKVDGAIIDNPKFFYQFASETEKIVSTGYRNMINMGDSDDSPSY